MKTETKANRIVDLRSTNPTPADEIMNQIRSISTYSRADDYLGVVVHRLDKKKFMEMITLPEDVVELMTRTKGNKLMASFYEDTARLTNFSIHKVPRK